MHVVSISRQPIPSVTEKETEINVVNCNEVIFVNCGVFLSVCTCRRVAALAKRSRPNAVQGLARRLSALQRDLFSFFFSSFILRVAMFYVIFHIFTQCCSITNFTVCVLQTNGTNVGILLRCAMPYHFVFLKCFGSSTFVLYFDFALQMLQAGIFKPPVAY